jgi:predicted SnoaL-like aldol condensation-catalyzing enzyme
MSYTPEQVADRAEIHDLIVRYGWAIDTKDWALLDTCFTEDVTYIEHILGSKKGREAVRAWIKPIMEEYGTMYTAYEWHMIDGNRVVVYMQNRRDNPEPGAPPIDFPGMTVLEYAGDGKFSYQEDVYNMKECERVMKDWFAAGGRL